MYSILLERSFKMWENGVQWWKWSMNQNPENALKILKLPPYTTKPCIFEQVWPKPATCKLTIFKPKSGIQDQSGTLSSLLIYFSHIIAFTMWVDIYFDGSYWLHHHKLISGSDGKHHSTSASVIPQIFVKGGNLFVYHDSVCQIMAYQYMQSWNDNGTPQPYRQTLPYGH